MKEIFQKTNVLFVSKSIQTGQIDYQIDNSYKIYYGIK